MSDFFLSKKGDANSVQRIVLEIIFLVILASVTIWLLYALRAVLLLLAITIIFCYLLAPLVDFFERPVKVGGFSLRVPRALAILIAYISFAGIIALAFDKIVPLLSEQLNAFFQNSPEYLKQIDQFLKSVKTLPTVLRLPSGLRGPVSESLNSATSGIIAWVESIALRTVYATKYLPWLVLIPLIGFFFLKDAKALANKLLSNLPRADSRYRATTFLKDVSETLAGYMRGQVLACLLVGLIEGTGLWLIGVYYPVVFAAAASVFEFVPIIGPFVLGVIAVLVASVQSWRSALLTFAFLAIFRVIHDYFIYPRLISRRVEIHPVAIILAVLCGAELAGVIGVFLSIPVVALLIVCLRHWRDLRLDRTPTIVDVEEPNLLRRFGTED